MQLVVLIRKVQMHDMSIHRASVCCSCWVTLNVWKVWVLLNLRVIVFILETVITQITFPCELHNRIFRVSRLSFSPSLSHWLLSGGTDVRGREVAMEMSATVAFEEDGSWQNEAEHQAIAEESGGSRS